VFFLHKKGWLMLIIYLTIFDDWSYWYSWQGWLVGWLDCFPIISHVVFCSPHKSTTFSPWAKAVFLCFLVTDGHRCFPGPSTGRLIPSLLILLVTLPWYGPYVNSSRKKLWFLRGVDVDNHGESQNFRRRNMARWQRRIPKTFPNLQMIFSDVPMFPWKHLQIPIYCCLFLD
jgi:hypothetical protein